MKRTADHAVLRRKVALVTGGNRGIGLAIARALMAEGCNVLISARDESTLKRAAREIGRNRGQVIPLVCDVRDPQAVRKMFAAFEDRFRRLDILVNNAGITHANLSVANLPVESWKEVIATNLTGMFLVTRAALPLMNRGGAIVNNLSIAATRVFPGSSAYSASKHGALGFTNTLREELRERGIRVIALFPGATDTGIWNAFWPDAPRTKMMSTTTVAQAVVCALTLPQESMLEELRILPRAGAL
ncbi:MAG TPA: SDR family NAD(P)-dependent oxidoreductase [Terriglobales bacterium]|nr:SDR family NAD(P)-dependent oxidoreductase [Terriglobales bacterium]